jgi:predicted enzyme related to lactoylglutathione lyase
MTFEEVFVAVGLRVCVDVPDLARGMAFYEAALGLSVVRRKEPHWAELAGAPCPIDLLCNPGGSNPLVTETAIRSYDRHWTPVHLDFVVDDLDAAVARAEAAGARLERPIVSRGWGRMANLADPFGHGLCLLQLSERGYDAIADP